MTQINLPNYCAILSQFQLIEVQGIDAEKYLQGQLTCDVTQLAVGDHTLTAHCDPKGKMSALFRLYRAETERFFVIIRKSLLPEALTQLKKYAVFSKVSFTELESPIYGTTSVSHLSAHCQTLALSHSRYLCWGEVLNASDDEQIWDLMEIQAGEPILLAANQFELIPQAVNLQCLESAISFTKGCYIGQETVARAKYRGANKRAMFTLVSEQCQEKEVVIGGSVELQLGENWKSTGTILSAVYYQQQLWVQIVLNKDIEEESVFRLNETLLKIHSQPYEIE